MGAPSVTAQLDKLFYAVRALAGQLERLNEETRGITDRLIGIEELLAYSGSEDDSEHTSDRDFIDDEDEEEDEDEDEDEEEDEEEEEDDEEVEEGELVEAAAPATAVDVVGRGGRAARRRGSAMDSA